MKFNTSGTQQQEMRSDKLLNEKFIKIHIQQATPYKITFIDKIVRSLYKMKKW